ncbi:MAG: hypothetical protein EGP65_04005, partial [Weissella confusa]|nr:hypothetical protein [Weissella confusa]
SESQANTVAQEPTTAATAIHEVAVRAGQMADDMLPPGAYQMNWGPVAITTFSVALASWIIAYYTIRRRQADRERDILSH